MREWAEQSLMVLGWVVEPGQKWMLQQVLILVPTKDLVAGQ
jgi:hypothetical protein